MNERIAQLAEEATYEMEFGGNVLQTTNGEVNYEIPAGFIEAFAKLIVRECVNVLDKAQWDKGEDWVCADGTRIIPQIKEHFGVEG